MCMIYNCTWLREQGQLQLLVVCQAIGVGYVHKNLVVHWVCEKSRCVPNYTTTSSLLCNGQGQGCKVLTCFSSWVLVYLVVQVDLSSERQLIVGSLLFTELRMLTLHACTCSSSIPKSKYYPKLMFAKVYKFVHVIHVRSELNSQDLFTAVTLLVHLYLYTHIWGRHGHLVLTSCVVACYMPDMLCCDLVHVFEVNLLVCTKHN